MRSALNYVLITLCFLYKCTNMQQITDEDSVTNLSGTMNRLPFSAFGGLLHPYFFYPPSPSKRHEKLSGLPPLPDDYEITPPTTLLPFRLIRLPPITVPPLPSLDSYGINTIPELPPQHESKYAGQFAPDGSFIGNKQILASKAKADSEVSSQEFHSIRTRDVKPDESDETADYEDDSFYRDPEIEKRVAKFLETHPTTNEPSSQRTPKVDEKATTAIQSVRIADAESIAKKATDLRTREEVEKVYRKNEQIRLVNRTNVTDLRTKLIDSSVLAHALRSGNDHRSVPLRIRSLSDRPLQLASKNFKSLPVSPGIHQPKRVHPRLNIGETAPMSRVQLRKLRKLQAILRYQQRPPIAKTYHQQLPIAKTPVVVHANAQPTLQVQQQKPVDYSNVIPRQRHVYHGGSISGEQRLQLVKPSKQQQPQPIPLVENPSIPPNFVYAPQLQPRWQPDSIIYHEIPLPRDPQDEAYLKEIEDYDLMLEFHRQKQQKQKKAALLSKNARSSRIYDFESNNDFLKAPQRQKYASAGSNNYVPPQLQVSVPAATLPSRIVQDLVPIHYNPYNNNNNGRAEELKLQLSGDVELELQLSGSV
ncbi:unnamed protein product [Toxocara canis]|uniref:Kazal-like domain-containing protein n=1 Tax=Toxocara canis TaxID=6265 RepID=A0A183UQR6_TOXCA|nr:unnamed protein product [Toxocara canis]